MPSRRLVALGSVLFHALVLAGVVVAQLLAVGPLPTPRQPLAFEDISLVQLRDIELPAPPRPATAAVPSVSPNAAPLVAPARITEETGLENVRVPPSASRDVVGVESGDPNGLVGAIPGEHVTPPPPPLQPTTPIRPHSGMQMPRKIVSVDPVYPAIARSARVEGIVILEAVLDTAGRVESVRVLRSIPLLDQAAVDAVRQWRFTPTLLNGVPVPVVMTVTVNFTLR